MNTHRDYFLRQGDPLNRRRPMFRESTKYAFASGFSLGALAGVLVTFTVALFR